MFSKELCDFPYFVPAGAPSAPKSAIAPKLSAQFVLINGTVSKISAVVSQKLQGSYLSALTSRSGFNASTKIRYSTKF
ncbi:unnamed protein product [Macrosiphum euphorbiae]|uniref:Uncharacterized protein n=1 Tax=Macrosiphum euphorbiae TaxID=13131 RepID=A0AAV0WM90_9HEMI|nr:unnamed protein product [Macrosiphum euphorbiae]